MSSLHTPLTPVIVPDSILQEILSCVPKDAIQSILEKHFPPETHISRVEIGLCVCLLPPKVAVVSLSTEFDQLLAKVPAVEYRLREIDMRIINACQVFPTMGALARRLRHRNPIHISNRCGPGTSNKMREFVESYRIDPNTIGPAGVAEREAILNTSLDYIQELCEALEVSSVIATLAHRRHLKTFQELFEQRSEIEQEIQKTKPADQTLGGLNHLFAELGITE